MKQIPRWTRSVFVSCLTVLFAVACHSRNKSHTHSVAGNKLPQAEKSKLLVAKVAKPNPEYPQILLHFKNPVTYPGLSVAFQLNPQLSDSQILGVITNHSLIPDSAHVITAQGNTNSCSITNDSSEADISHSNHLEFKCGANTIHISLTREDVTEQKLNQHFLKSALQAGATTHLRSQNEELELTVQKQEVILYKNNESQIISIDENQFNQLTQNLQDSKIDLSKITNQTKNIFEPENINKLTVATYNVENFWDDLPHNSIAYDDFSSNLSNWYTDQFASLKASRIKTALLAAGLPDVVGLQEIESAANTGRSLELLKPLLTALGYNYYALGQQADDNPTAVTTAVISKYPIIENTRIDFLFAPTELDENQKKDFAGASRDPQRVTIALPEGAQLSILNSHWKSKRDKSPWGDVMRKTLAQILKDHMNSLKNADGSSADSILMGDFNADYRENHVQEGLGLADSLASARKGDNSQALVPLWLTLAPLLQGDYPHDSHLQALDNIVVTASLLKPGRLTLAAPLKVIGRTGYASEILTNGDGLPLRSQVRKFKGHDNQIRTTHFHEGFSDHLPLVATFNRSALSQFPVSVLREEIENQTIAQLPTVEITGAPCSEKESANIELITIKNAKRGQCIFFENISLSLQKTGLYHIYFNPAEEGLTPEEKNQKIIISADRAFGQNKNWLRGYLQTTEGKTLKKIRGRIGIIEGHKAIIIHNPKEDIEIIN